MECASARFASRCGGEPSIRPHLCAAFEKRCTKMRSNRPFVAVAARGSHARALHARASFLARAWSVRGVRFASRCGNGRSI
eukprot:11164842-Lingulodinium_polyedra.AAC.1